MPDQTQRHDQEQHDQRENGAQSAKLSAQRGILNESVKEQFHPRSPAAIQRERSQDDAGLAVRWPELTDQAEAGLKRDFQEIAAQGDRARRAIDHLERTMPRANKDQLNGARKLVDEEISGARRDVNEARQAAEINGGNVPRNIEERMDRRYERLSNIEKTLKDHSAHFGEAATRGSLLRDKQLDGGDLKQALWELSGRELQNRELADFRRREDLPDQAVVFRDNDTRLIAADISVKRLLENINQLSAQRDQAKSASVSASIQDVARRPQSSEENERIRRLDQAGLAERWPELRGNAEKRLKNAFRDVSEQADRTRQAAEVAAMQSDPDVSRLQEVSRLTDEEMRLARLDVAEAREGAENLEGRLSDDVTKRLDARTQRLARLERELTEEAGEGVRNYLKTAGLDKVVESHRKVLEDGIAVLEEAKHQAKANKEVSPNEYDVVREQVNVARQELRELDRLLDQKVPSMRPDLVEARMDQHGSLDRLRIDITDFTHRVNSITHTIKAHVYREAIKRAFPDADLTMFEYRSPTMNKMIDSTEEFKAKLESAVKSREEELRRRREEEF